jgi:hypothetical protein
MYRTVHSFGSIVTVFNPPQFSLDRTFTKCFCSYSTLYSKVSGYGPEIESFLKRGQIRKGIELLGTQRIVFVYGFSQWAIEHCHDVNYFNHINKLVIFLLCFLSVFIFDVCNNNQTWERKEFWDGVVMNSWSQMVGRFKLAFARRLKKQTRIDLRGLSANQCCGSGIRNVFFALDPRSGMENSDPGYWINIPDPQHCDKLA